MTKEQIISALKVIEWSRKNCPLFAGTNWNQNLGMCTQLRNLGYITAETSPINSRVRIAKLTEKGILLLSSTD